MRKTTRQESHPFESLLQREVQQLPGSHHWENFFREVESELNYFFQSFRGATSPTDVIRTVKQVVHGLEQKHKWAVETSINNPRARDFLRQWFYSFESVNNKPVNVAKIDAILRQRIEPLLNQDLLYTFVGEVTKQGQVADRQTWLNLNTVLTALYFGENPSGPSVSESIMLRYNHYRSQKLGPAGAVTKVSLELHAKLRAFRDGLPRLVRKTR